MSSVGITVFVKTESNAKTYRSSNLMETFFLPNVKSLFVSKCCSSLVNTCITQLQIREAMVLLEIFFWMFSFN